MPCTTRQTILWPAHTGFSLPELAIGLVLIVIAIGLGAPQLQTLQRGQQLRQAAVALAQLLAAARTTALTNNQPCELETGTNQLSPTNGSCGSPPLPGLNLTPPIRLASPSPRLRFSASGMLTGGPAQQELVLVRADLDSRICVAIERPSALVRIGEAASAASPCRYAS